jgi:hypothetical protein
MHLHYNNMGLFCDPNIIANNKEKSFWKSTIAKHNSSQTLNLLRYHNIRTRTIASLSQLPNLIKSQTFPIITASIHCLWLTLHWKLFATNSSLQRFSESIQKSIDFRWQLGSTTLVAASVRTLIFGNTLELGPYILYLPLSWVFWILVKDKEINNCGIYIGSYKC